ncbi:MAG: hypothetical protein J6V78_03600 [Clostridia bacterium]|nr:hypothetical protein [Clostridia bacterium]
MRFSVYKSMLDLCNTLKEAISYMYENNTSELVSGCLDVLVSINSTLTENNVEVFDYEKVQNIANEFNSESVNLEKIYSLVIDLETEIKTNVKYKLKVLFVAELAGKWDSMASVYEAMKNRDDCEVEVVIQPIFRAVQMPDGSVKSDVILNDYLTPMGISNIPYDQYDFAEKLPDITFFSQPYETCTVEKFWPENMAKFTRVVYLPYYTARTINKDISQDVYYSFFKSRAEQYSWKIVTQSEIMRFHYENFGSQKGVNSLVTGLPKWDYSANLSEKIVPCPEAWKSKIEGKTVFLFNTHFTLNRDVKDFFEKCNEMISIFKKNKKIALIWRPHPMTETIIKLYHPEFKKDFETLKNAVVNSENMLIDTEPTYDAAFVYSDAMLSCLSSLIDQYVLRNKPVLLITGEPVAIYREKRSTNDGLYDLSLLPFAYAKKDKLNFIEKIAAGIDDWADQRKELVEKYLTLADGKCGERVVEKVVKAFKEENEDAEIEINPAKTALIIGSVEDSELCVKQFEKNGVEFAFAEEFVANACAYKTTSLFNVTADQFDLFVVTDKNSQVSLDMLKSELGIPQEKIISFWQLYKAGLPTRVCDRIMLNPSHDSYDGVILGLSNVEVGIIPSQLKATFCNLAVSSQDIYYNLKTLEYCYENYYEKLKNLKYAIVDLHDYNYFSFDTSMSTSALKYLGFGGYNLDAHNFANNKNVEGEYSNYVERIENLKFDGLNEVNVAQWSVDFADVYELDDYAGFASVFVDLSKRKSIVTDQQIAAYKYDRSNVVQIFDKTVKKNVEYLEKLLQLLVKINPEIKIYLTVLPKFVEVEAKDAPQLLKHKNLFYEIVENLSKKFTFEFLDFKKISEIMYKRNYFFDANHLNYFGAIKLTDEINNIIFK